MDRPNVTRLPPSSERERGASFYDPSPSSSNRRRPSTSTTSSPSFRFSSYIPSSFKNSITRSLPSSPARAASDGHDKPCDASCSIQHRRRRKTSPSFSSSSSPTRSEHSRPSTSYDFPSVASSSTSVVSLDSNSDSDDGHSSSAFDPFAHRASVATIKASTHRPCSNTAPLFSFTSLPANSVPFPPMPTSLPTSRFSGGTPTKITSVSSGTAINFARPLRSSGSLSALIPRSNEEKGSSVDRAAVEQSKQDADTSFEDPAAAQHIFGTSRQRVRRLNLSIDATKLATSPASPSLPSSTSTSSSFSSGSPLSYFPDQQQQLIARTESPLHRSLPPSTIIPSHTVAVSSSSSLPTPSSSISPVRQGSHAVTRSRDLARSVYRDELAEMAAAEESETVDMAGDLKSKSELSSVDRYVADPLDPEEVEAHRRRGMDFGVTNETTARRASMKGSKKGRWSLGSSEAGEIKEKGGRTKRMSIAPVLVSDSAESDSDLERSTSSPTSSTTAFSSSASGFKARTQNGKPLLGRFIKANKKVPMPLVISEPSTPTSPIDYAALFHGTPSSTTTTTTTLNGYPFPSTIPSSAPPGTTSFASPPSYISPSRIHTVESAHALFTASLPLISPSFSEHGLSMSSSIGNYASNRTSSSSSTRSSSDIDIPTESVPSLPLPTASSVPSAAFSSPALNNAASALGTTSTSKIPAYQVRRHQQTPSFGLKELRDLKGAAAVLESEARRMPARKATTEQAEKKLKRKPVPVVEDEIVIEEVASSNASSDGGETREHGEEEHGQRTIKASATIRPHRRSICDLEDPILLRDSSSSFKLPPPDSSISNVTISSLLSSSATDNAHARTASANSFASTAASSAPTSSSSSSRPPSPLTPFAPGFTFALPINPPLQGPPPSHSYTASALSPSASSSLQAKPVPGSPSATYFPTDSYSNDISSFWTADPNADHRQSAWSASSCEDLAPSTTSIGAATTVGDAKGGGGYMGMKLGGKLARKFGQGRLGGSRV